MPLLWDYVRRQNASYTKEVQFFSITTDAWTDTALRKYICVTYHWVDQDFTIRAMVGDMICVPKSHTWDVVCKEVASRIHNHMPETGVCMTSSHPTQPAPNCSTCAYP
jgi:hypothetical protein